VWTQTLKPTFKNFLPRPQKFGGGKRQISPTAINLEVRNFKTAQHVDK